MQGAGKVVRANLVEQNRVANAFLSALRAGDFQGLLAVLDPNVVVRIGAAQRVQERREKFVVRRTGPGAPWPSRGWRERCSLPW